MNSIRRLSHYYKELEKDFHIHYMEVLEHFDEKTIHKMRINMKRQAAFFDLLEALNENFSAESAAQAFHHLYKRAGKLRNIQVERMVIAAGEARLELEPSLSEWLANREEIQKKAFQDYEIEHSLVPVREMARSVYYSIGQLQAEGLQDRYLHYFEQLLFRIKEEIDREMMDAKTEQLHQIRKHVKGFYYNLQLTDGLFEKVSLREETYEKLDYLQRLLGDWHDRDFTLRRILKSGIPCSAALLHQLESEKKSIYDQLRVGFQQFGLLYQGLLAKVRQLLSSDRLEVPVPPKHLSIYSSFKQENVGERFK